MMLKETEKIKLNCENDIEIEINIKYNIIKEILIKNNYKSKKNKKNLFVIKMNNENLINKQSIIKEVMKNIYSNCLKFMKNNNNYETVKNTNIIINNIQSILELLTHINYDENSSNGIIFNGILIIKIKLNKDLLEKNIQNNENMLNITFIYTGSINKKYYNILTDNPNIFYNIKNFLNNVN